MSIFDLEARSADRPTLSVAVLDLVDDMTRDAPIEPTVRFVGPVNTLVDPELGDALLAVIRESLSNAIRHSGAHNVEVTVEAGPELVVTVHDDGRSKPGSLVTTTGHGLRNLAARAQARGGAFRVVDAPGGGTDIEWRVPVTD